MEDERKNRIRSLINKFSLSNDLFYLADAQILINKLLRDEGFPIEKYKQWKK